MKQSGFTVTLKRIIAVDSASFAYAEVPLDMNIVLLATGNIGKSSIINAVRFFLLPEINARGAENKFAFISGAGDSSDVTYFSTDDIYDHYFPSEHSRLILEVEHKLIDGTRRNHCQIISRGNEYKLQRTFVPEPYTHIERLFWVKDGDIGARPATSIGNNLLALLKDINSGTKQYTQTEQLVDALYSLDPLRPDECPFVVFPLGNLRENTTASLRALVKMLFNQDGRSLRLMTATAIEAKDAGKDVLEIDIGEIITEQRELKKRQDDIAKLKALEPKFSALQQEYKKISEQDQAAHEYATRWINSKARLESLRQQQYQIGKEIDEALQKSGSIKNQTHDTSVSLKAKRSRLNDLTKTIAQREKSIQKCEQILLQYPQTDTNDVLDLLQEHLDDKKSELESYSNANARTARLAKLKQAAEAKEARINKLRKKANDVAQSLKSQLPTAAWQTLYSVNQTIANANPGRELSKTEHQALTDFCELFTHHGPDLHFFDEELPLLQEDPSENVEGLITQHTEELNRTLADIRELEELSKQSSMHSAQKIEQVKRDISLTEKDIEALQDLEYNEKRLKEESTEKAHINETIETLSKDHEQLKATETEAGDTLDTLKKRQKSIQDKAIEIESLLNEYDKLARHYPLIDKYRTTYQDANSQTPVQHNEIATRAVFEQLTQTLAASERAKRTIEHELMALISQGILTDEHGLLAGQTTDEAVIQTFLTLAHQFELLDQNTDVLARDTERHNEHVKNRLERLSKTKDQIEIAINQINQKMEDARINDLEAVKLNVGLNAHFADLVDSWRNFDSLSAEGTLSESWYLRLQEFLKSDAVNQTDGKLRMINIIKGASYITKKANESWDEKDQSTSTKMLINTHFCNIFIQELSSESASIAFPIIIDEIGKISSEQFPRLLKGFNEQGHWLIGITTHGKSGGVIAPFGNYLIMDEFKTAKPYAANRRKVCYSREMESIIEKPKDVTTGELL